MPIRNITIIFFTAVFSLVCYSTASHNRDASILALAIEKIETQYIDEVDRDDLFEQAMQGMVSGLDEHSRYITPPKNKRLNEDLEQQFAGVGIRVQTVAAEDDSDEKHSRLFILGPMPDSPAAKAGLLPGDEILAIDGRQLKGLKDDAGNPLDPIKLMRGKVGEPVQLTIGRHGKAPLKVSVQRARIMVDSVLGDKRHADGSWDYFLRDHPQIGYIRIEKFGERTAEELRKALQFNGHSVKGFILDLRGNPGGLLDTAVEVSDLFIDDGIIVTTRGRGGIELDRKVATRGGTALPADLPMVVMIDGLSASASEIVSACLQDHGRAKVVGQRSWGKGTVQNIIKLNRGKNGALKLTTARYWRPSGRNIDRKRDAKEEDPWGVTPDEGLAVSLSKEDTEFVLLHRNQLDYEAFFEQMHPEIRELLKRKPTNGEIPANFQDPQLQKAIEVLKPDSVPKKIEEHRA